MLKLGKIFLKLAFLTAKHNYIVYRKNKARY